MVDVDVDVGQQGHKITHFTSSVNCHKSRAVISIASSSSNALAVDTIGCIFFDLPPATDADALLCQQQVSKLSRSTIPHNHGPYLETMANIEQYCRSNS